MSLSSHKLPFEYSKTPPVWLTEWPNEEQLRDLFTAGLRRYAAEVIRRTTKIRIEWDDDSLKVSVGNQAAVWRLSEGQWRRYCSCGYKNDRCVHTYAAARLFSQIIKTEGWLRSYAPPAKRRPASDSSRPQPRKRVAQDTEDSQLPLWGDHHKTRQHTPSKLEIEVDFHHQTEKIALRFYAYTKGRRRLLRLQQLYNLGLRMRHGSVSLGEWNEADQLFLKWLPDRLRGKQALRQNLNLIKVAKPEFKAWQDTWANHPGRFLERNTQQILGHERIQTAMHVELRPAQNDKGKVEITLLVTTPDGKKYPFHEVYGKLVSGSSEALVDGRQLVIKAPFSANLLQEVFRKKQPLIPRDKVQEFLPVLLENRLDLVFGPLVEHRKREAEAHIHAEPEGANVLISFRIGEAPVHPDTMKAAGDICLQKGKFVILDYVSPGLPGLCEFVRAVEWEKNGKDKILVPGRAEAIENLVKQWRQLPDIIHKHTASELSALLRQPLILQPEISCRPQGTFVDVAVDWTADGVQMSHAEVVNAVQKRQPALRTTGGMWAMLDLDATSGRLQALTDAGLTTDQMRMFRPEAKAVLEASRENAEAIFAQTSKSIGEALINQDFPSAPTLPDPIAGVMRHYQEEGFAFLADRARYGLGAILADDMGLGKTLQILTFLAGRRQQAAAKNAKPKPALVVCPASVTGVWQSETEKFPLGLKARVYAGDPGNRELIINDSQLDLLIINYSLLRNDMEVFRKRQFDVIVLDEAQYIKNPGAQITQCVKELEAEQRFAITGTPLENRALDLWSIMDFLNPGYLGSIKAFSEKFETKGPGTGPSLGRRIAPVMLRRTKQEVAPELPPRTEETIKIELSPTQRQLYQENLQRAREALKAKGPVEILAAITRLRQICCHPPLVDKSGIVRESAKMAILAEMLEEIISEGHSALVFSQFASVFKPMAKALDELGMDYLTITGQTPATARQNLTREFTESPDPQVFLLSLKAAGTGLTLTKADYVFLFDPWWNPAVENQAIDRTHRIGQDKPVMAYRLVAANTIEENVMKLQKQKAELFEQVMNDAAGQSIAARLTTDDLRQLLN